MKKLSVDRSRFLAVAAALAGVAAFQACTVVNETRDMGSAGTSSDGGDDGGGGAGKGSIAGSKSQGGEGGAAKGGEGGAAQGGDHTGNGGDAAGGVAGLGEPGGAAGAGGAGVCDDTSAAIPKCDNVTAECLPYCNAAIVNLKNKVAAIAVSCLEADKSGNCDAGYGCLAAATHASCPEDVAADCTAAADNCGAPDATDPPCAELLSGFTDAARAEVVKCTTDQGCFSVYSCAEGFFFE